MARSRVIKPEFWSDEKVGTLSLLERLLYIGLWNFADDEGLCRANPMYLRSMIFPYDDFTESEIDKSLKTLEGKELIYLYQVNGQKYLWIIKFRVYQRIDRPQKPTNPSPKFSDPKYKKAIFKRDNLTCYICGKELEYREFYIKGDGTSPYDDDVPSVDHIVSRNKSGSDYPTNLKCACLKCNKSKHIKDVSEITIADASIRRTFDEHSTSARDQTETETEVETETETETIESGLKTTLVTFPDEKDDNGMPSCPHEKIIALYHEILPMMSRIVEWSEPMKKLLRTRWRESAKRRDLSWWRLYFEYVSKSDFLCGREKDGWMASLEWLVRPTNMAKVLNGQYENRNNKHGGIQKWLAEMDKQQAGTAFDGSRL